MIHSPPSLFVPFLSSVLPTNTRRYADSGVGCATTNGTASLVAMGIKSSQGETASRLGFVRALSLLRRNPLPRGDCVRACEDLTTTMSSNICVVNLLEHMCQWLTYSCLSHAAISRIQREQKNGFPLSVSLRAHVCISQKAFNNTC